jgi:hypothetical protein
MHARRIEHTFVSVVGLSLGIALAVCIAQGDILLPMMAAITLAVSVHEFFKGNEEDGRPSPLGRSQNDKHIGSHVR